MHGTVIIKTHGESVMATIFFIVPSQNKFSKIVISAPQLDKMVENGILEEVTPDKIMDRFAGQHFKEVIEFAFRSTFFEFKPSVR